MKNNCLAALSLTIIVTYFVVGQGQSIEQTRERKARKFDEFTIGVGSRELRLYRNYAEQDKELKARLARYAKQLQSEGARPYAITYSPRVVEWEIYNRSIAKMRAGALWEVTGLGVDWRHINVVNGGFREVATTELWIVPPGAQPPRPTPTVKLEDVAYCPYVRVGGSPYLPTPNTPIEFKAIVNVNDNKVHPAYVWSISQGKIVSGQWTDTIAVELPADASGEVVAKVALSGYSLECPVEATTAISRTAFGVSHFKFDEFGNIPSGDTKARLDNLAVTLQNDPTLQLHVVIYGGRLGPREQVQRRAEFIKNYLVQTRGMELERIITIDGGYRDELSGELWLSLKGTNPPVATPTIDKTYVRIVGQANNNLSSSAPAQTLYNQTLEELQPSRRVDEYGDISSSDESARLGKFAAILNSDEDLQGVIVAYGGRTALANEALERADRAKRHLVDKQVFYNSRINTVDCGYREKPATELWVSPVGASPPICSPTVNPNEVQIKGRDGQRSSSRPVRRNRSSRNKR